ncbi:MAG TPA: septum formation initiator family protein [Verrucomicrobiae bacterium]|jgi:cell division protein FtsL|nr:septum formation initiator family protein [Verrucomicrobiae bacterium]
MARNRKNQSAAFLFGPALKASLICFFIVVCCVGYVWQKKQIAELSQQIRTGERHLTDVRDKNEKLKRQLATLLSPASLEARARELKLGLGPPQPNQIWRLTETVNEPAPATREAEFIPGKTQMLGMP